MPPELEGFICDYCNECRQEGIEQEQIPQLIAIAIKGFCNHYNRRDLLHYQAKLDEIKAVVDRYFQG